MVSFTEMSQSKLVFCDLPIKLFNVVLQGSPTLDALRKKNNSNGL